jgi:hypothetical protein
MHLMEKDPRAKFRAWRERYGDVFCLYMGSRPIVVLSGYDVIKEALVKLGQVFSERPSMFLVEKISRRLGTNHTTFF